MAVLLDIKNASKRYGDQVLLDCASATITDDGKVGFIGRNGAGKSTLLRVILGRRLHAERANTSVLALKRQLEDFIARNKARASTASRAKSKSKELERLELGEATGRAAAPRKPAQAAGAAKSKPDAGRTERDLRREIGNLERSIARLDADKKRCQAALLATSDVEAAIKLHAELTEATTKLAAAEESWLALQEQLSAAGSA